MCAATAQTVTTSKMPPCDVVSHTQLRRHGGQWPGGCKPSSAKNPFRTPGQCPRRDPLQWQHEVEVFAFAQMRLLPGSGTDGEIRDKKNLPPASAALLGLAGSARILRGNLNEEPEESCEDVPRVVLPSMRNSLRGGSLAPTFAHQRRCFLRCCLEFFPPSPVFELTDSRCSLSFGCLNRDDLSPSRLVVTHHGWLNGLAVADDRPVP